MTPVDPDSDPVPPDMHRDQASAVLSLEIKPIHKFFGAVRDAVLEYDKSDDHVAHAPGADCARCRVAAVVWASGAPAPITRASRSRSGRAPSVRTMIEVFPLMASGVSDFDEDTLLRAKDAVLHQFPGMSVTVGRAVRAAQSAQAARVLIDFVKDSALLRHAERVLKECLEEAESCARVLRAAV